jgi:hypothetical protein
MDILKKGIPVSIYKQFFKNKIKKSIFSDFRSKKLIIINQIRIQIMHGSKHVFLIIILILTSWLIIYERYLIRNNN